MLASVVEDDSRPRHERRDGSRHQYLPWARRLFDPGTDVNGDAGDVVLPPFDLACVQAGSNLDPDRPQRVTQRTGTVDGAGRAIEGGEYAVTGVDLVTAEAVEVLGDKRVVASSTFRQARSPRAPALAEDPTMSVNSTVTKTRSVSTGGRTSVRNAWISSAITSVSPRKNQ